MFSLRRLALRTRYFAQPTKSHLITGLRPQQRHSSSISTRNIFQVVQNDELDAIPIENIRNFSVIAHVDHGKSTLSDVILKLAGNIDDKDVKRGQVMDTLKVERERGITVKAQTASMLFHDERTKTDYLLNLIDTPGHIDFSYEVSRSLASCQGALLLVDSTQSIQAQTLANHQKAKDLGLQIIPVVTKIDLPSAMPEDAALAMGTTFGVDPSDVIMTSAKSRIGILEVMQAVVDCLPSPGKSMTQAMLYGKMATDGELDPVVAAARRKRFHGRIVDSWFDPHRGVVCLVQAVAGSLAEGSKISTYASVQEARDIDSKTEFSVQDVGLLTPVALRTGSLRTGQVGYVIAGLRSTRQARIGDTMFVPAEWEGGSVREAREAIMPLEGYAPAKPMLYASVFPVNTMQLEEMFNAVDKLVLNDSSISVVKDQSSSLGAGLRCGFLGFLHMEVFHQRLSDEFGIQIVMTTPSVPYIIESRNHKNNVAKGLPEVERKEISSVADWPTSLRDVTHRIFEPVVKVTLITPQEYYGPMVELLKGRRADGIEVDYLDDGGVIITALVPWQEVVCDMNDHIKNASAGYASFNYVEHESIPSDLVKVEIAVNGEPCDPLSFVCHSSTAAASGRRMAAKLKDVISRQNFEIILQAKVGAKVLARERIAPYRKDVLTKGGKTVGGGDISRKKKLLEKQKEGKKRGKMVGKVEIDQSAFWAVLQR